MGIYSQLVDKNDKKQSSSRQDSRQQNRHESRPSGRQNKRPSPRTTKEVDQDQILSRPKAFYITKKQSDVLDDLVKAMRKKASGKSTVKIDRSTVIRLLLDRANLEDESAADELIDTLVEQLSDYFA